MSLLVDAVLLALLVMVAIAGWHRGGQVVLAVIGGIVIGVLAGSMLIHPVTSLHRWPGVGPVFALAAAIGGGVALGARAARRRDRMARRGRQFDAAAGSLVAVSVCLVLAWFILPNLARGPFRGLADVLAKSGIIRALTAASSTPPGSHLGSLDRGAGIPRCSRPPSPASPPVPAVPVVGAPQPVPARRRNPGSFLEHRGAGPSCFPGFLNRRRRIPVVPVRATW